MSEVKSILLVGVGGQGAILTAKVLVNGLMRAGYDVKMSEVHGMSQRGGSVSTQVRWGEKVYSPLIGDGAADYMVAFEKMEAVRYASFLKPDGVAVINDYEIASATIAARALTYVDFSWPQAVSLGMSALVAGLTVGGKAVGKTVAIRSCTEIVFTVGKFLAALDGCKAWVRRKIKKKKG